MTNWSSKSQEAVSDTVAGETPSTGDHLGASIFAQLAKVGRYELIYRIGSGGMATVFVGRLSGLAEFEKLVAVKIIHQHLANAQHFIDMFLDEARVAAAIHHPNVAEIYEVGKDKDLFFMVGEFVHGQDLGKILRRADEYQKSLSLGLLSQIGAQVCFGLHAAHETRDKHGTPLDLIHRDISPNNILISYDGFVKVIDFGVAWASNRLAQTDTGALKGKVGYVAPEQITGQPLDRRSDIFSAGVMQYIMATMTHPFPGSSDAERLQKIVTGEVTPPREINPSIPEALERIIMKAMSTSPDHRYETAAQMGQELESFAQSTGEEVKSESLSSVMSELFSEELNEHQTRLNLFRETRQTDAEESYSVDLGRQDRASQEVLSDRLVNAAVKKATWRNMWIFGTLLLMVLGLAIAVFFLYKEKAEKESIGSLPGAGFEMDPKKRETTERKTERAAPAETSPPTAVSSEEMPLATSQSGAPVTESSETTTAQTDDEAGNGTKETLPKKKKTSATKSSGPELIQNPY